MKLTKQELKKILSEQREKILNKKFGVEREQLNIIKKKIKLPHIITITGLRRSGKSTFLRQIIKKYYSDEDFYYIDFEDERLINFKAEDFNEIYEVLIELFGEKKVFFIDEIQNIKNFQSFIRRLYDSNYKFFITGSNSGLLKYEIGTKLTGRHVDITITSFSFFEYLKLKNIKFEKSSIYKTKEIAKLKRAFSDYLYMGGMPEYLIFEDKEILMRIYEDLVLKDVVARHGIENIAQLRELYQYVINNFSNKFSYNNLRKLIGIKSVNTIKQYLNFLEESFFIKTINKFDYSLKKRIMNDKKIYIIDNGFIPIITTKLSKDKGWMLENLVFKTLISENEIFYYFDKNECDFIIKQKDKITQAIQVCYNLTEENKKREINGLLEAMNNLNLKQGLILTYDQEEELKINNKKIKVMPVWKWLLE